MKRHFRTLRNNVVSFLLIFSVISVSCGQTKPDLIKAIKKEFTAINNDNTLKKVTLENEEFLANMTDGGGELTGYFSSEQIKKIFQWMGLSNGNETTEFYFKNEELIFVFQKFDAFAFDEKKGSLDYTKTATAFEGRYYFNHKKLIDSTTTGHYLNAVSDAEQHFLTESKDDLSLLKKNNK